MVYLFPDIFSYIPLYDIKYSYLIQIFQVFLSNTDNVLITYLDWLSGKSVHQRSERPVFNPRSHQTKDFKSGT